MANFAKRKQDLVLQPVSIVQWIEYRIPVPTITVRLRMEILLSILKTRLISLLRIFALIITSASFISINIIIN